MDIMDIMDGEDRARGARLMDTMDGGPCRFAGRARARNHRRCAGVQGNHHKVVP